MNFRHFSNPKQENVHCFLCLTAKNKKKRTYKIIFNGRCFVVCGVCLTSIAKNNWNHGMVKMRLTCVQINWNSKPFGTREHDYRRAQAINGMYVLHMLCGNILNFSRCKKQHLTVPTFGWRYARHGRFHFGFSEIDRGTRTLI